jgi:hypothetical protein
MHGWQTCCNFKLLAHRHHNHHHHHHHHDKRGFSHLACSAYQHELLITAAILATGFLDFFF